MDKQSINSSTKSPTFKSTKTGVQMNVDVVPKKITANELQMGIKVEMEHTNDRKIAKQIAIDHLKEDPAYYSKLDKVDMAHESISTKKCAGECKCACKSKKTSLKDNYDFTDTPSTYSSGYDRIGESKNLRQKQKHTSIMKLQDLKKTIRELLKEELDDMRSSSNDDQKDMNVTGSDETVDDNPQGDMSDDDSSQQVTLTLDKDVAQKMCDLLQSALTPDEPAAAEAPDTKMGPDQADDSEQLSIKESKMIKRAKELVKNRR
jgi:hypothetical protein